MKTEDILKTEFSEKFVKGMRDRMVVSFHKYGRVADAYPKKLDAVGDMQKRLQKYAETGNTEWLMDVANFAMIEFMHPRHPNAHFEGTDDDASPGRSVIGGGMDKRDNFGVGRKHVSALARFRE
jgi:hypothetical protein